MFCSGCAWSEIRPSLEVCGGEQNCADSFKCLRPLNERCREGASSGGTRRSGRPYFTPPTSYQKQRLRYERLGRGLYRTEGRAMRSRRFEVCSIWFRLRQHFQCDWMADFFFLSSLSLFPCSCCDFASREPFECGLFSSFPLLLIVFFYILPFI